MALRRPAPGFWLPAEVRDTDLALRLRRWTAAGLFLRVLLLPIGVTSDTLAVYWRAHVIAFDGTVFRDYLVNAGAHVVHAAWLWIARPFLPSPDGLWTDPWWWDGSYALEQPIMDQFLARSDLLRTVAVLKVPYLLADVAAGIILLHLVARWWSRRPAPSNGGGGDGRSLDARAARRVTVTWAGWMLSPFGIYATMWFGRYESFPVLLVLLALLFLERDRPLIGSLLLGIAITMRTYPIAFVPVLALLASTRPVLQARFAAVALAPFAAVQVFGMSLGASGELAALSERGLTDNWLAFTLQPGSGPGIPLTPAVLLCLVVVVAGRQWGWWGHPIPVADAWRWLVLAHLGIFAFSHFSVHYVMWLTPAIALLIGRGERRGIIPLHLAQGAGVVVASLLFMDARPFLGALGGLGQTAMTLLPPFLGVSVERAQVLGGLAWSGFVVATLAIAIPAARDAWTGGAWTARAQSDGAWSAHGDDAEGAKAEQPA